MAVQQGPAFRALAGVGWEGWGVVEQVCHVPQKAARQPSLSSVGYGFSPQPRELDPSAVLPLDALLAFVYFDLNFCGYLHRRDVEKLLLTLELHLCKEQVSSRRRRRPACCLLCGLGRRPAFEEC